MSVDSVLTGGPGCVQLKLHKNGGGLGGRVPCAIVLDEQPKPSISDERQKHFEPSQAKKI